MPSSKPNLAEEPVPGGEALLAVLPLLFDRVERRQVRTGRVERSSRRSVVSRLSSRSVLGQRRRASSGGRSAATPRSTEHHAGRATSAPLASISCASRPGPRDELVPPARGRRARRRPLRPARAREGDAPPRRRREPPRRDPADRRRPGRRHRAAVPAAGRRRRRRPRSTPRRRARSAARRTAARSSTGSRPRPASPSR